MNALDIRNQKIIDAVLEKEKALCPGAVALIGIYGSFLTGDIHPLSDLDLLILITTTGDGGWEPLLSRMTWVLVMIFTARAGTACGRTPAISIPIFPS